ncbi:MAG: DUF2867 domain-containing protein [Dysgonomonas sp.]|nr:DUF2867 domain-containing protein [Dysgonomonas sp.]
MKVVKSEIPENSLILNYLPANYTDVYKCTITDNKGISADDIQVVFWTRQPKWLKALFNIRNSIVRFFGLKTDRADPSEFERCIRAGSNYHFTSIPAKSANETIIYLQDKHLSAYLSVYIEDIGTNNKTVYATTLVHFHYWLGYAYFYTIYPFHHLVVKKMLKQTLMHLS